MYRGLVEIAAEWQYANFGFYHPAITFLILLLLLASPVLVWNRVQKSKSTESASTQNNQDAGDSDRTQLDRSIVAATGTRKIVAGLSLVTAFCAFAIGIYALALPSTSSVLNKVTVNGDEQAPPLGPTQLDGKVLSNRVAVMKEDFLTKHHSSQFAPVVGQNNNQSKFRFFVEFAPTIDGKDSNFSVPQVGFLRKGGLPTGLSQLYESAGFTITPDYYVLFPSIAEMRRPYLIDMAEFLVTSLCLGLLTLIASYRVKRLTRVQTVLVAGTSA